MPATARVRLTPWNFPLVDLPVTGGMWVDDATRPPGAHRFSVNVRNGIVRPGSLYDSTLGTGLAGAGAVMPNGIYSYRTPQGCHYKIALRGTTDPRVSVVQGSRVIFSGQLVSSAPRATTTTYHANVNAQSAQVPVTWGRIGNKVVFCGPLEGKIGVVEFHRSGRPEFRLARAYDRTILDQRFNAADDVGPYRRSPPYAVSLAVHEGRVVVVGQDGTCYFSNANDVDAYPYNNLFYLQDGMGSERTTSLASVSEGRLVVSQRDGIWDIEGALSAIATTTVAKRTMYGRGVVAPASVQVVANGVMMALSEAGPFMWVSGTYIPASGALSDGVGPVGALFNRSHIDDLDIDRYRPLASGLAGAISRYSKRLQVYEVAIGALVDDVE